MVNKSVYELLPVKNLSINVIPVKQHILNEIIEFK